MDDSETDYVVQVLFFSTIQKLRPVRLSTLRYPTDTMFCVIDAGCHGNLQVNGFPNVWK